MAERPDRESAGDKTIRIELLEKMKENTRLATEHILTITPQAYEGSVSFIFVATCSCRKWTYGPNAFKWVALEIQQHLKNTGMVDNRGAIHDTPRKVGQWN